MKEYLRDLIQRMATKHQISVQEVFSPRSNRRAKLCRWELWTTANNRDPKVYSLMELSRVFNCDHTTVRHGIIEFRKGRPPHGTVTAWREYLTAQSEREAREKLRMRNGDMTRVKHQNGQLGTDGILGRTYEPIREKKLPDFIAQYVNTVDVSKGDDNGRSTEERSPDDPAGEAGRRVEEDTRAS